MQIAALTRPTPLPLPVRWKPAAFRGGLVFVACLLLAASGVAVFKNAQTQARATEWVVHTQEVVSTFERTARGVAEAESALRGFSIMRDPSFLAGFQRSIDDARGSYEEARRLTLDNPRQQRSLDTLGALLEKRIAMLVAKRDAVAAGGTADVAHEAQVLTLEIRSVLSSMEQVERSLLGQRRAELARSTETMHYTAFGAGFFALLLVVAVLAGLQLEVRRRLEVESQLTSLKAHDDRRLNEIGLMLRLGELLQASRNVDEAYEVVAALAPKFFEKESGAVCIYHPSRNMLEAGAKWGKFEVLREPPIFGNEDCWALRRGQPHLVEDACGVACRHSNTEGRKALLCVPLTAHGEVLGILHLASTESIDDDTRRRAVVLCEQISMALANLQLRETLKNQSIRDPLTGLFNRRYAEETLPREIMRTSREKGTLSVLMIDVDHFKKVNDTYGHDAGDAVLKKIAQVLQTSVRGSDFVSRLGGEELMVVLPGANGTSALQKANALREKVSSIEVAHGGRLIRCTVSIGVAGYPQHGVTAEELQRRADLALYRAKNEGRNRAVLADTELKAVPAVSAA